MGAVTGTTPTTPEEFFDGVPQGLALYREIARMAGDLGDVETRVSKSQIAFRRRTGFAYVWLPGRYVRSDVPAVLSFALRERLDSPRFKEVVHPSSNVWMHHLELHDAAELDDEVRGWLRLAYDGADLRRRGLLPATVLRRSTTRPSTVPSTPRWPRSGWPTTS